MTFIIPNFYNKMQRKVLLYLFVAVIISENELKCQINRFIKMVLKCYVILN